MRRRAFITALGCAAATWRFAARAEQRIARIGYLGPDPAAAQAAFFAAFRAGLRDLGYVEGENIEIESRFSEYGQESRLSALASELVDLKVDVIVAGGPAVYAAHNATKTVPIVATVGGDLVGAGLADSLSHPGGNVTGQTYFAEELLVKRLALLKQVKPAMTSVGLLVTQGFTGIPRYLRALDAPVKALGVTLRLIEVSDPSNFESALTVGPGASVGGLVVTDLPPFTVGLGPATVAAAASRHGLPSAGGLYFARNGGLLAYGVDFALMHRRAATFVDKILKGAKPGDLPIEQATKFITIVNLKTAKALGLEIPPTLLASADEVIE
jgi:putative tryptophan/tyrosine transport system substrate-binding protein